MPGDAPIWLDRGDVLAIALEIIDFLELSSFTTMGFIVGGKLPGAINGGEARSARFRVAGTTLVAPLVAFDTGDGEQPGTVL